MLVTVNYPVTSTIFIDRFLAGAEAYSVPTTLVFNKLDLLTETEHHYQRLLINLYETIGYKCIELQAVSNSLTDKSIDQLLPLIENKVTLFSGNSGVGKSLSLIHI